MSERNELRECFALLRKGELTALARLGAFAKVNDAVELAVLTYGDVLYTVLDARGVGRLDGMLLLSKSITELDVVVADIWRYSHKEGFKHGWATLPEDTVNKFRAKGMPMPELAEIAGQERLCLNTSELDALLRTIGTGPRWTA